MSVSEVSICNRTLDLLGIDPITSLDDDSKPARVMLRNYAAARDRALRSYPWNCAMRRASLPALAEAPAWGYARYFQLPEGPKPEYCLRVHKTEWELLGNKDDYKIEGRYIATDADAPLNILYVAQVTDPAKFDVLLQEVIAADLGVYAGAALTEAGSRMDAMTKYLAATLVRAKIVDAREGTAERIVTNYFDMARR